MTVPAVEIWLAAMVAAAIVLAVVGIVRRQAAWALAGAFLAGSSGQLGLTDPLWFGSLMLKPQGAFSLACYGLVALQAATAALYLVTGGRLAVAARGVAAVGPVKVALLCVLLLASAAAPMGFVHRQEWGAFAKQVIASGALIGVNAVSLAAIALAVPADRMAAFLDRAAAALDRRKVGWLAALWVLAVTVALNVLAFDRMPRLPDEVSYLFHAGYFAAGQLFAAAPPPELQAALRFDWIDMAGGKWFSIFPPGWPAVLALGVAIGMPWIVNPILAAAAMPLTFALVTRVASRPAAIAATLLLAVSPWFLATGASMMSHPLTLVLVLGAWLLLTVEERRRLPAWFGAGLLMGALFLTRPLEGVIVGTLTGLWAMSRADLRSLPGWVAVAAYGAGCILLGALVFPYNQMLTGDALVTPIDRYFDLLWHPGANRLGFGADIGSPDGWGGVDIWPGHGPVEALIAAQFNWRSLNVELLGWAIGSVLPLFVHLIWGRLSRIDWCMIALIVATVAGYSLYWFNGGFYVGPRYWFMALWPAIWLSARGIATAMTALPAAAGVETRGRVGAMVLLLCGTAMIAFLPWRAATKYWEFRGYHAGYRELAASGRFANALVFVKSDDIGEYGSAFMLNSPDLSGPLFAMDRGATENARLAARLPGRRIVVVDPVAGPGGTRTLRLTEAAR